MDAPIPECFLCPILQELMTDPVSTCDGHTYERAAIAQWLQRNSTSPLTNVPLPTRQLTPNVALRGAIEAFLKERQDVEKKFVAAYDVEAMVSLFEREAQPQKQEPRPQPQLQPQPEEPAWPPQPVPGGLRHPCAPQR